MSTATNTASATEFEFTLEEQWAIHDALLDHVEVAVREDTDLPRPAVELALIEKIESGDFAFTPFELDRLRHECELHATSEHAPEIDREPARSVVEKIEGRCAGDVGW